jgi:hypothetical protein
MNFLGWVAQWLLKIFLSGLFNKVMTRIEEEAKRTKDAGILHAESTVEAKDAEVEMVKAQAKAAAEPVVKKPDDPFGADDWNKG